MRSTEMSSEILYLLHHYTLASDPVDKMSEDIGVRLYGLEASPHLVSEMGSTS